MGGVGRHNVHIDITRITSDNEKPGASMNYTNVVTHGEDCLAITIILRNFGIYPHLATIIAYIRSRRAHYNAIHTLLARFLSSSLLKAFDTKRFVEKNRNHEFPFIEND